MEFEQIKNLYPGIAINGVLSYILKWGMAAAPKMIVELGVSKEALANKVLALVAKRYWSMFFSCDIGEFSKVCDYPGWMFHQGDDIEFSKQWTGPINLLFIDTDELYPHTKQEIDSWFPHLAKRATVMFRCTNLQKKLYYEDGRITGLGWDNQRGVIRAIEEYLDMKFNETMPFRTFIDPWEVIHYPWGAGLTVMRRG